MKKMFIIIAILTSAISFGQNKDSLLQVEAKRFVDSISKTPVSNFIDFVYETYTAKRNDEFMQMYNNYLQTRYKEFIERKNKK